MRIILFLTLCITCKCDILEEIFQNGTNQVSPTIIDNSLANTITNNSSVQGDEAEDAFEKADFEPVVVTETLRNTTSESELPEEQSSVNITTETSDYSQPAHAVNETPEKLIRETPQVNHVEVRDPGNDNRLCVKASFAISFSVMYNDTEGSLKNSIVDVAEFDPLTVFAKNCSNSSKIAIPFQWNLNDELYNSTFTLSTNNETYNLTGVEADFYNDPNVFPGYTNETSNLTFSNGTIFGVPGHIGRVYECMAEEDIIVVPNRLVLRVTNLKIQALDFSSNHTFNTQRDICTADRIESKVVPIIVGCVLAGLIVLVLVSYVIASRRYKKYRGYETL